MRTHAFRTDEQAPARDGAQSIRRALGVLRVLAMGREAGLGLTEIARLTGLTRPTAHRILGVLVGEGIVEQKARTRRYAVGEQVGLLALSRPRRSVLIDAAEPHLRELARVVGDTLFLTLRSGLDTVCVARRAGDHPIQVLALEVGDRRPLGVSSAGFAMLASLDHEEARAIVAQNRRRLASYRITMAQSLDGVALARKLGHAVRDHGIVPGTKAVSVGIRNRDGETVAALTVAGIARRMPAARIAKLAGDMRAAAEGIERALRDPSRAGMVPARISSTRKIVD